MSNLISDLKKTEPEVKTSVTAVPSSSDPSIADLFKDVQRLAAKVQAQEKKAEVTASVSEAASAPSKKIDWASMTEQDVFDLSIPIPVIDQRVPDYMEIHLKNREYLPRWVHSMKARIGPCLALGYSYITEEDFDPLHPPVLGFDASGHYSYADVVALKVPKSRYWPAIRRNAEVTNAQRTKLKVDSRIRQEIENTPRLGEAFHRGALSIYEDTAQEEQLPDMIF